MTNFFFAYLLLRKFFFVPILQFIEQDAQKRKMFENVILGLEEQVVVMKKKQQKQRDHLKVYFLSHKPDYTLELVHNAQSSTSKRPNFDIQVQEIINFREELRVILQKKFWL